MISKVGHDGWDGGGGGASGGVFGEGRLKFSIKERTCSDGLSGWTDTNTNKARFLGAVTAGAVWQFGRTMMLMYVCSRRVWNR